MLKFQVQQLGAGFFPIGNWYWCRVWPSGSPSEALSAHGPYLLRCFAVRAAQKATR